MSEQHFDVLQLPTRSPAQLRARAAAVVGCDSGNGDDLREAGLAAMPRSQMDDGASYCSSIGRLVLGEKSWWITIKVENPRGDGRAPAGRSLLAQRSP